jgi:hypothetical protein
MSPEIYETRMNDRENVMGHKNQTTPKTLFCTAVAALVFMVAVGCAEAPQTDETGLNRIPPGQEFSGFLGDYSELVPNPDLDSEALTYANPDEMKSLRQYVAIVIDPVEIYVASDADESLIPERSREAVAIYFRHALVGAISDVYPVVETPGPLVLRLRSAVVGIDVGGTVAPIESPFETDTPFSVAIVIDEVVVEMELVDSVTGERIVAAVDRTDLGEGAEVGSSNFSRDERFSEAKVAFDGWAADLRDFLDLEHELSDEDVDRASAVYAPYSR